MKTVCPVCMHHCTIEEGKTGLCRARSNENGRIVCTNYGKITSYALDPIEKKPLRRFFPGSKILSVGSYGCNLSCGFCQNHGISMVKEEEADYGILMPEELVNEALAYTEKGNIGIAYTYNEPLIGYEYVRDCAKLARKNGLKNVIVTNGCAELEVLEELLPYTDAFNIDLKGFTEHFYKNVGGSLSMVKAFIERAAKESHVEVTTLIIPGENDDVKEIKQAVSWLASIDENIPYHVSRFFPMWEMKDKEATGIETVYSLAKTAREHLKYVYEGNC
ncbi:AmmeMemoRadiSam system radical SAM enzyme [Kineothrix sedimenti]|uniref:AmmeMemoRadiSam system radical SAM enzyme n=1 Tax=Kineothrix sedimenti TaxID=3123317 RepID=A0ABZ3F165_9FIRM